MTWTVAFYSDKVEAEALALPPGILANFLRTVELIEEFGPDLGRPHTAPLGKGLFEIRAKGREGIARSVFCTVKGQEIIILITVIKKGNTIPKRQMDTARKRMKKAQDNEQ
jgi:phage-related protein